MINRIRQVEIHNHSLMPAAAEVRITVSTANAATPTTELRGRLTGPRCPYATTVEVAYPLRPLPQPQENLLAARVIIPEASLWEPESPFLYQGAVELWQDGQCCERVALSHGLRSLHLGPAGLRVNGRLLTLHGRSLSTCNDDEALALRRAGVNLLVVPVADGTLPVWDVADRLGFLVLGRVSAPEVVLAHLTAHASCFGWLLDGPVEGGRGPLARQGPAGPYVGLELDGAPPAVLPPGIHFLCGPAASVRELAAAGLPILSRGAGLPDTPGAIGCVE
jgi:hypothetical protein